MRSRFTIQTFQVVHDSRMTLGKVYKTDDAVPIFCSVLRYLCDADREHMLVLALDPHYKIIGFKIVASGTLTSCVLHMRDIFQVAITFRAASIILAHSHPSQSVSPSKDDIALSDRALSSGEILGIPVLDHIVLPSSGTDRTWASAMPDGKSRFAYKTEWLTTGDGWDV